MKLRLVSLALCCGLSVYAWTDMSVRQLVQFVGEELTLKQQTDKQIATYVAKEVHLTERLTDKTIDDLRAQGAGPLTLNALRALRDRTIDLKSPVGEATSIIPPPSSGRYREILDQIRQYAINYTQNLPNFICLQVIRQYVDADSSGRARLNQTINAQLNYHDGQEEHEVVAVNGKITNIEFDDINIKLGGAISTGEFGGLMQSIFDANSHTAFDWDHWGTWDGERVAVIRYSVDREHSNYHIRYENSQQLITAYKGLVYADPQTGAVLHITFEAVDVPSSFPVQHATETLDFGDVDINGKPYLCPLRAELRCAPEIRMTGTTSSLGFTTSLGPSPGLSSERKLRRLCRRTQQPSVDETLHCVGKRKPVCCPTTCFAFRGKEEYFPVCRRP